MVDVITRLKDRDGDKGSEDSLAFTLRKPIDLATFGQEMVEALGLDSEPGIVAEGSLANASSKDPVVLWIMDPDINSNALKSIVNAHVLPVSEMGVLVEKALSGEDLDDAEMQKAIRLLLISRR